ncbi:MAG: hypothetical protein JXA33_03725, partial [Anaerolineae bacterium]|nr:hypothetical protein [Anaerolineae bacterium]
VVVDLFEPMPLAQGDVVLLCSDGLTDMLDDPDILRQVGGNAPQKAAKRLIDAANKAGGIDNISVVLAQVGGKPAPAVKGPQGPGVFDRLGKLSGKQWGLILGLLALVLLVVGGVAWAISRTPQSSLPSSTRQPSVNDPTVTLSSPGSQATPDPDTQTSSGGKATSTPLPSPTPLPPTATRDPNRPTPKPGETLPSTSNRLITMNSPTLGEIYENPIGFSWTAELRTGEAYQVTVRHTETGHVIYSGTQQEENWLQTLPLDKTGEWWWKVDIVKGQDTVASSQEIRFILTTDIGSGDNGGGGGGGGGSDCHTEEYECNCSTDLSGKKTCETCTREVCE